MVADITTGLKMLLHFTGNGNDSSGNGNNGTVDGATLTTDKNNVPNQAYDFDGINDDIIIIDSDDFNVTFSGMTLNLWVNSTDSREAVSYIWGHLGGNNNRILLAWDSRAEGVRIFAQTYDGTTIKTTVFPISLVNDGDFHMISLVVETNGDNKLYADAVLEHTLTGGSLNINPNINITMGSNNGGQFYDGKLDEARYYNRPLTQEDLTELLNVYDGAVTEVKANALFFGGGI